MSRLQNLIIGLAAPFVISACATAQTATLPDYLDMTYTTRVAAASQAETVAWVDRKLGEETLFVATGDMTETTMIAELSGDVGDTFRGLTLSPDGQWMTYRQGPSSSPSGRTPNPAGLVEPLEDILWLVNLSAGTAPISLPAKSGSPTFSPDSSHLAITHGGSIRILELTTDLTDTPDLPDPLFEDMGGIWEYAWSPDGQSVAFISGRRVTSYVGVFTLGSDRVRWIAPSTSQDMSLSWSPDGTALAWVRIEGRSRYKVTNVMSGWPFEIWTADVASGEAERLYKTPGRDGSEQLSFPVPWLADGRVAFLSEEDGFSHIYIGDRDTGEITQITSGTCEIEKLLIDATATRLLTGSNCVDRDRREVSLVEIDSNTMTRISAPGTIATDPAFVGTDGKVFYRSADAQTPPAPTLNDGTGIETALTEPRRMTLFAAPRQISFNAPDGMEITGTLFPAQGVGDGETTPAVVYVHGGPVRQMMPGVHRSIYYANAYATNQYLAAQGITVLSVNYRTGRGFGRDFRSWPTYGPHGADEVQDVIAAGEYLAQLDTVDAERVGIYGGSVGGYLTALSLGRRSDLFKAGVSWHGIYDWTYWKENPAPGVFNFTPWGTSTSSEDTNWESSPMSHVETWTSPTLLISGDDDRNVLFDEFVTMHIALEDAGQPVEAMVLPNEIHGFLMHQSWVDVLERTTDFLQAHLSEAED
ncbi:MAG: prolyl oligopeptidase family serine peptidase [Henriciella sp.]|nr:prolyl oligopeptidase family serine peptidase [Henriciella sp.]